MAKLREIHLPTTLRDHLVRGHPWVYRTHVSNDIHLPSGSWVKLRCAGWTGYGLWDDQGAIAIRIFSDRDLPTPPWFRQQVQAAWELRSSLRERGCTAYRWLFGEGDGLPGLTVDLYGDFAVVQTYMPGADELLDWLVKSLIAIKSLEGISLRTQHSSDRAEGESKTQLLWGKPAPQTFVVQEHGLKFEVNLHTGQKTGLFLDHRENRRFVEGLSGDRTVLNCFSYTGAFSLYALRGNARQVTSVDIGKGLAESADKNVALNHLNLEKHTFITQDCFELLDGYAQEKRLFDLVILDPPSFAKSKQNRYAALRGYTKLNALAMRCVAPDGLLVSASCTSQVSPEAFKEMLAAAGASAGRRVQIIHEAGHAIDHPVPAQFPEGRYLKFVVGRIR